MRIPHRKACDWRNHDHRVFREARQRRAFFRCLATIRNNCILVSLRLTMPISRLNPVRLRVHVAMAGISARMIAHSGGSLCRQEGSDFSCRPVGSSSKRPDIAEERLDATGDRSSFVAIAATWAWMHAGMPAYVNASMPSLPLSGRSQLETSRQTLRMQRLNAGSAIASAWIILLIIHAEPPIPVCRSLERAQDQEARAGLRKDGRNRHNWQIERFRRTEIPPLAPGRCGHAMSMGFRRCPRRGAHLRPPTHWP